MTTAVIRQKLQSYIETIDNKKAKALYTMLETDIEDSYDHWKDKDFIAEMERRSEGVKNGTIQTYSWDEVKKIVLKK